MQHRAVEVWVDLRLARLGCTENIPASSFRYNPNGILVHTDRQTPTLVPEASRWGSQTLTRWMSLWSKVPMNGCWSKASLKD